MPQHAHLMTHQETAVLMRCSLVTVRRLRYRGELPTTRVGSRVLIPREAVEAYLASHTTTVGEAS